MDYYPPPILLYLIKGYELFQDVITDVRLAHLHVLPLLLLLHYMIQFPWGLYFSVPRLKIKRVSYYGPCAPGLCVTVQVFQVFLQKWLVFSAIVLRPGFITFLARTPSFQTSSLVWPHVTPFRGCSSFIFGAGFSFLKSFIAQGIILRTASGHF